jgi:hypothetical protein
VTDRCSPPSAPFPPRPPQEVAFPLCGRFTGTAAQSDFSNACMSVVRLCAFTDRPSRTAEGVCWRSPGSRTCCFSACTGSNDYAGPDDCSRVAQPACCLPSTHQGAGILIRGFSELDHPAHRCLDLRFATHLAMCHARLEVRMDSLLPFLQGLAPLQHVGLSRRTVDYRPLGSYPKTGVMSGLATERSKLAAG